MKYGNSDLESLIAIKVATLLHDPPHKMWAMFRGVSHEDEAGKFARLILEETALMELYEKASKDVISRADVVASSSDRWALIAIEGKIRGFLKYEYLHNIFDPRYRCRLTSSADTFKKAKDVAKKLNNYLKLVEKRLGSLQELRTALYNTLYLLLELLWYSEGLQPSLADTRTPTHTI
ncbi:MAG: DUF2333 family protein, partial [Sulfolobales archaeon]|nr:DUF2333 family protein [Sulfolobales archaeon]